MALSSSDELMSLLNRLAERSLSIFLSRFSFSCKKLDVVEILCRESVRRMSSTEGSLDRRDLGRSLMVDVEARLQVE